MLHHTTLFVVLSFISCGGCFNGPSSGNTPDEMYSHLLGDPIPTGISNLEGVGDTWQGYSIYLRFNADESAINEILATEYETTKWEDINSNFDLPNGYNKFYPSWNPEEIALPNCYKSQVSNDWTGSGSHYLVIDPESGLVYFYGIGA